MGGPHHRPGRTVRPDLTDPTDSTTTYGSVMDPDAEPLRQQMDAVVEVLHRAIGSGDLTIVGETLHPDVTWGDCAGRASVLAFLTAATTVVDAPESVSFEVVSDRIIATLAVDPDTGPLTIAIFVRDIKVVELADCPDRDHALSVRPVGDLTRAASRGWKPDRLSPVLPVAELSAAVERFRVLGFEVRTYEGDALYAFASRGPVEIHLSQVHDLDPTTNSTALYLYVDDADATYASWRLADVKGRLVAPSDTDYGLHEGAYADPDGNLIRFGSPIT